MRDVRDRELAELARELPWRAPDAARRDVLRDALVLEAQSSGATPAPSRSRRLWWIGGAALAAAAALFATVALRDDDRALHVAAGDGAAVAPVERATIEASTAADFVHTARLDGAVNDEVVRLRGGKVALAVAPLAPRERFRVVSGDSEVDARGSAFEVAVIDDRLESVTVASGLVEIHRGDLDVTLHGGDAWSRDQGVTKIASAAPVPPPAPVPAPAPVAIPAPPPVALRSRPRVPTPAPAAAAEPDDAPPPPPAPLPTTPTATPTELAFRDGRTALHDGDFATAAAAFQRAIAVDPDAPLAEDARYWRGIALARAGRADDARVALADFLDRHPTSLHAGRAALVLGNLLVLAGDTVAARARFAMAVDDADAGVRAAARRALDALTPH